MTCARHTRALGSRSRFRESRPRHLGHISHPTCLGQKLQTSLQGFILTKDFLMTSTQAMASWTKVLLSRFICMNLLPFPLVWINQMSKKTWRNIQERRFAPHCKGKTFTSGDAFNLNSSLFIQNIFRCPAPGKRGANKMASTNFPSGIKTHKFSKIGNFDQKSCTYHHMCSEIKMSFIFRSDLIFDK